MKYSNKVDLSIIIPCYNVEKYLYRCLNSLINTTYEILLIDDGSTDNTSVLCDSYKKYSNVKVFHKVNGGLSDARNYGIERATGKYIVFLDSDDYVDVNSLEILLQYINNTDADLIYCDFFKNNNGTIIKQNTIDKIECLTGCEAMNKLILNKNYYPMVWKCIYRRDFIIENSLYFKKSFLHEDEDWMPRALFKSKNVILHTDGFYYYCLNSQSITQNKKDKNYIDLIEIVKNIRKDLKTKGNNELMSIDGYFINIYLACYIMYDNEEMYLHYSEIHYCSLKIKYILCKYFRKIYKKMYILRLKTSKKF